MRGEKAAHLQHKTMMIGACRLQAECEKSPKNTISSQPAVSLPLSQSLTHSIVNPTLPSSFPSSNLPFHSPLFLPSFFLHRPSECCLPCPLPQSFTHSIPPFLLLSLPPTCHSIPLSFFLLSSSTARASTSVACHAPPSLPRLLSLCFSLHLHHDCHNRSQQPRLRDGTERSQLQQ